MTIVSPLALRDAKNRLSEVVDQVALTHDRVTITRHGRPAAVLLSVDDLEGLLGTLEIMSDPAAMAGIREGLQEHAAGRTRRMSKVEALTMVNTVERS